MMCEIKLKIKTKIKTIKVLSKNVGLKILKENVQPPTKILKLRTRKRTGKTLEDKSK